MNEIAVKGRNIDVTFCNMCLENIFPLEVLLTVATSKVKLFLFMFIKFKLKIEFSSTCLTIKFFSLQRCIFAKFFVSNYDILILNCCRTLKAHEVVPFLHNRFYWWCSITCYWIQMVLSLHSVFECLLAAIVWARKLDH